MTLICQAVDTTRDLIACHDSDTRYDEICCRSAVAALYLPIIGLVIGALQQLYGYGSEDNSSFTPDVAMAIATSSITTLMGSDENKGELASQVNNIQFLMTFLSMLRTMKMSVSATADNTGSEHCTDTVVDLRFPISFAVGYSFETFPASFLEFSRIFSLFFLFRGRECNHCRTFFKRCKTFGSYTKPP